MIYKLLKKFLTLAQRIFSMSTLKSCTNIVFSLACCLLSLTAYGQCDGSFMNGDQQDLMGSDSIEVSLDTCSFWIVMPAAPGPVYINSQNGIQFLAHPVNTGVALRLDMNDPISGESPFEDGPLLIANTATMSGPFYGGVSGYIGVMKEGKFGYIELADCGSTFCDLDAFQFKVIERCLEIEPGGNVTAGGSIMAPAPIPTMGEWALIILALLTMIVGVAALNEGAYSAKTERLDGR